MNTTKLTVEDTNGNFTICTCDTIEQVQAKVVKWGKSGPTNVSVFRDGVLIATHTDCNGWSFK